MCEEKNVVSGGFALAIQDSLSDPQYRADGDAAVRNVEGREIPSTVMQRNKINDVTQKGAINQIADGPGQNRHQREALPGVGERGDKNHPTQNHGSHGRNSG